MDYWLFIYWRRGVEWRIVVKEVLQCETDLAVYNYAVETQDEALKDSIINDGGFCLVWSYPSLISFKFNNYKDITINQINSSWRIIRDIKIVRNSKKLNNIILVLINF